MQSLPWPILLPLLVPIPWAGLLLGSSIERTGRGIYGFWLFWAGFVYPSGALLLLAVDPGQALLGWLYILVYLGQLLVLGTCTARRLQDAGRSRWSGLLLAVPIVGTLPALSLLAMPSEGRRVPGARGHAASVMAA